MALAPGTQLGPYEIVSPLGSGGMGDVYRARDTKLNRDVALKILPEAFANDPERLARFEREAQVLAALNHPNIAAIYGLEDSGTARALVLELVEGSTLADRIAKGPIPLDETLPIAKQIAEALEAANEQGIIHRDLKPANVKVRDDGTVKVLDFGLAKALEGTPVSGALANSPTITSPAMTGIGVILGTAAYMAPEQARGKPADRRADIWAFGVVLFEMLTGQRAFEGEFVSDVLAAVLKIPPSLGALPATTPPLLRQLIRRCLEKDPGRRLQAIGEARVHIEDLMSGAGGSDPSAPVANARVPLWRRAMLVAAGAVLGAIVAAVAWLALRAPAPSPPVARFTLTLPEGQQMTDPQFRSVAISPDGSNIAYVANRRVYLRSLSDPTPRIISGTDLAGAVGNLVFSPDGRSIAYVVQTSDQSRAPSVKKIDINGGTAVTLAEARAQFVMGLSWDGDSILFADPNSGLVRISATTGKQDVLVPPSRTEVVEGASLLRDGSVALFAVKSRPVGGGLPAEAWDDATIVAQTLRTGERKTLIEGGSDPHYVAGRLLYARGGTIFAVPFDPDRLLVRGDERTPVAEGVARTAIARTFTGMAQFGVSLSGSAVYVAGPSSPESEFSKLAFVDRAGKIDELKLPPRLYVRPRVSPNGRQLAFGSEEPGGAVIWIYDMSGASQPRQLTFNGRNRFPIWADDSHVTFQSDVEGDAAIYLQRSDGTAKAERLTKPDPGTTHTPESWSRDGKYLVYTVEKDGSNSAWMYSMAKRKGDPLPGLVSRRLIGPTLSPDGAWVAFTLTDANRNQIFAQRFPSAPTKYLVGDGARPVWSPNGKEIFFYGPNQMSVVTVTTRPSFGVSNPVALPFNALAGRGPGFGRDADMMPDGRFIAAIPSTMLATGTTGAQQYEVVLNWFEELNQKAPSR